MEICASNARPARPAAHPPALLKGATACRTAQLEVLVNAATAIPVAMLSWPVMPNLTRLLYGDKM